MTRLLSISTPCIAPSSSSCTPPNSCERLGPGRLDRSPPRDVQGPASKQVQHVSTQPPIEQRVVSHVVVVLETVVARAITVRSVHIVFESPDELFRLIEQLCEHVWLAEVRRVPCSVLKAVREEELSDDAIDAL